MTDKKVNNKDEQVLDVNTNVFDPDAPEGPLAPAYAQSDQRANAGQRMRDVRNISESSDAVAEAETERGESTDGKSKKRAAVKDEPNAEPLAESNK